MALDHKVELTPDYRGRQKTKDTTTSLLIQPLLMKYLYTYEYIHPKFTLVLLLAQGLSPVH